MYNWCHGTLILFRKYSTALHNIKPSSPHDPANTELLWLHYIQYDVPPACKYIFLWEAIISGATSESHARDHASSSRGTYWLCDAHHRWIHAILWDNTTRCTVTTFLRLSLQFMGTVLLKIQYSDGDIHVSSIHSLILVLRRFTCVDSLIQRISKNCDLWIAAKQKYYLAQACASSIKPVF